MIVSIPLNACESSGIHKWKLPHGLDPDIARVLKNLQEQQMKNRDKRSRLMSELLANIRSIKLYAWENTFIRRISEVRNNQELKMLRKIGFVTVSLSFICSSICSPVLTGWQSCSLEWYTTSCSVQLFRNSRSDFFEAPNVRHYLPGYCPVQSARISSRHGMFPSSLNKKFLPYLSIVQSSYLKHH